jgi:hypothetical protein
MGLVGLTSPSVPLVPTLTWPMDRFGETLTCTLPSSSAFPEMHRMCVCARVSLSPLPLLTLPPPPHTHTHARAHTHTINRERPQVVQGKDGEPLALFLGMSKADGYGDSVSWYATPPPPRGRPRGGMTQKNDPPPPPPPPPPSAPSE